MGATKYVKNQAKKPLGLTGSSQNVMAKATANHNLEKQSHCLKLRSNEADQVQVGGLEMCRYQPGSVTLDGTIFGLVAALVPVPELPPQSTS